ncbi:MAG: M23 family metallopeptidase [bacterium]
MPGCRSRASRPTAVILLAAAGAGAVVGVCARSRPPAASAVEAAAPVESVPVLPAGSFSGRVVGPGENLAQVLAALDLSPEDARAAVAALGRVDFDFQRMLPGDSVTVEYAGAQASPLAGSRPARLRYDVDLATSFEVRFGPDTAEACRVMAPVETTAVALVGIVRVSLWQSLLDAGADDRLAASYTSILRHRLPRLRDMHPGDSFAVVVERLAVGDSFYGFGRIHALGYVGVVEAWGFHHSPGGPAAGKPRLRRGADEGFLPDSGTDSRRGAPGGLTFYCDADGRSLGPVLSYPPVVGARRTSDFGPRLHPVVRRRIQHNGLDYEASHGTPVRAVEAGAVCRAGWRSGYGRTVEVEHATAGLVTRYSHLSRYAEGIKPGAAVGRGDLVGYVGSTGLSSGAHLDFGTLRDGRHVDPLEALPSRVEEVGPAEWPEFERFRDSCRAIISRVAAAAAGKPRPRRGADEVFLPDSGTDSRRGAPGGRG